MWTTQASVISRATPEAVWKMWEETENWPKWDAGLEWVKLEGAMGVGTKGQMKPKGGMKVNFTLLRVEPNRGFSDRTHLPLTKLDFHHNIEPLPDGTVKITHVVNFTGPLSFLFSRIIGKDIAATLPDTLRKLSTLAEGCAA